MHIISVEYRVWSVEIFMHHYQRKSVVSPEGTSVLNP